MRASRRRPLTAPRCSLTPISCWPARETGRPVVAATAGQLVKLLGRDVVIYPAPDGEPQVFPAAQEPIADLLTEDERAVAVWAMRNNEHAGATTDTLSQAQCLYLAIRVGERVYGAVGVAARGAPLDPFEHSILLSILGECALALENLQNAAEKERAAVLAKNEQLRANMLRAISHDLRTPLTAISGNASNLLSNGADFDEDTRRQLYSDIYDDSLWLINVVENLLSVTRIEDGRMALRPSAELVEEIVTEALNHVGRGRTDHVITFTCEDEWLMARADARLIVQVVVNIVDNALKYTPPGSHIDITAAREDDKVVVTIADDGPGVPPEVGERVFDMFFSGLQPRRRQPAQPGTGFGAVPVHHHRAWGHNFPLPEPAAWRGIPLYFARRGGAMA